MKCYEKIVRCILVLFLAAGLAGMAEGGKTDPLACLETENHALSEQPPAAVSLSVRAEPDGNGQIRAVSVMEPDGSMRREMLSREEENAEESDIVPTQIVVETDALAEEDKDHVTYQLDSFHVLEYEDEEAAKEALQRYGVQENAEADYVRRVHIMDTGSEDYQYKSWGPESIHSREFCKKILERYGSDPLPEVTVGVIDTGVDYNHEFLKGRMGSFQHDFVDDDGDAMDEHFHGTHVAGIIADTTLPNVKINAYRALDASGYGTDADVAAAIAQAVEDHVDVINLSLGGLGTSAIESAALDKAIAADIVVVVAAGNEGGNAGNVFPASYPEALTVAALEQKGEGQEPSVASYSNYGAVIDVCAPGSGINSPVLNQQYELKNGTSMAAPFVAASAALLRTYDKEVSYAAVSDTLKLQAKDLGEPGFDIHYGCGEVDLSAIGQITACEVAAPCFDKVSGEYDEAIEVTITSQDADAVIYYTTDGSIPTGNAENPKEQIYSQPIHVDKSCALIAVAKKTDREQKEQISMMASARYYIGGLGLEDDFVMDAKGNITGYTGYQAKLVIPDSIQGRTVEGIGNAAFQFNSIIHDVTIPDTVVRIGGYAFNDTYLERLYLGKNVKELGDGWIITGLKNFSLRELVVDEENPYFTVKDEVLYTADMEELVLYLPNKAGQTFRIPDTVRTVRYAAIQEPSYLKVLEVPANVNDISFYDNKLDIRINMFWHLDDLLINVDEGNQAYSSEHGILYNKDKTVIYYYSKAQTASEYVMPDSVKRIYGQCFCNNNLTSIVLSKNLQMIDIWAFSLPYVDAYVIPSTVTYIADGAFDRAESLYFDGNLPHGGREWVSRREKVKVYRYPQAQGFEELPDSKYELYDRTDGGYLDKSVVYTVNDSGALFFDMSERKIVGYMGEMGGLSIPLSINNVPVEKIGEKAFKNCGTITSVTIPSSVTEIGEEAFSSCSALSLVKVAGSVRVISQGAFSHNGKLQEIILEEGVQKVCQNSFAMAGTSRSSAEILRLSLPSSLMEIDDYAFSKCAYLNLNLPEGLVRIGKHAFDESAMIWSSLVLPKGLKVVDDYAFWNTSWIETLDIPEGVEYIGDGAFFAYDFGYLQLNFKPRNQFVTIRGHAGEIGEKAFCDNATIYYEKGAENFDQPALSKYHMQMMDPLPESPSLDIDAPLLCAATNKAILLEQMDGYEYCINFGENWQTSPLFTGLTEDTSYTCSIRKAGYTGGYGGTIAYKTSSETYPLTAKYGDTLEQCASKLPRGFAFVDKESVQVGEIGNHEFAIRYDTEDEALAEALAWTACIRVTQVKPQITDKPTAAGIVWGQPLGDSQLSGGLVQGVNGEELRGSWHWEDASMQPSPAELGNRNYWVVFEPEDNEHYKSVRTLVAIKVEKTMPQIAAKPVADPIRPGQILGDSQLSGGLVQGVFGEELRGGWSWKDASIQPNPEDSESQSYAVVFEPEDSERYTVVETAVTVKVEEQSEPPKALKPNIVARPTASAITLGQMLGDSQLSGGIVQGIEGEELKGVWNWKDAGIKPGLEESESQSYAVEFYPEDSERYTVVETAVTVKVEEGSEPPKALKPNIVARPTASAITLGQMLGDSQLSGGIVQGMEGEELKGVWSWKDAGIKPSVEESESQSYAVVFYPEDSERYMSVETTVTVRVNEPVEIEDPENKAQKVTKISISSDSRKIAAGKKVSLKVSVKPKDAAKTKLKWTSDNIKYATVNSRGIVSTKRAGAGKVVTITATATDGSGKKATIKIKLMRNAVTSVKVKNAPKILKAGKSIVLRTVVKTNGRHANKALKWTSSKTKYAFVSAKGRVIAKKAGRGKTVVITVSSTDGTNKKTKLRIRIR